MDTLKTLEEIAAMPVGMEAVLEAQRIYVLSPELIRTQKWLQLIVLSPLGSFICELSADQLRQLHDAGSALGTERDRRNNDSTSA